MVARREGRHGRRRCGSAGAREAKPDRSLGPHRRNRGPQTRTDSRVTRLALPRPSAHRAGPVQGGSDARAPPRGRWRHPVAPRRRSGMARAALRSRRAADRDVARSQSKKGRTARRFSSAPSAGSSAGCVRRSPSERTPSSSATVRRSELGVDAPALLRVRGSTRPHEHRRGRLRPRRRPPRFRACLGRGAGGACARTWWSLVRPGAGGHDGHELARVVALHARRDRAYRVARGDQRRGRPADARPL